MNMKGIPERPLYLAGLVIGMLSLVVGAITIMSDLRQEGIPGGGSVITLLVGVTILAMALTGPSEEDDRRTPSGGEEE